MSTGFAAPAAKVSRSSGIGEPVRARPHRPDAVAGVVGEEERAGVAGVVAAVVERRPRRGGAPGRAGLAGHDQGRVVPGVVRRRHRSGAGRVQVLADVQIGAVVPRLAACALVARPAEVVRPRLPRSTRSISSQVFQPTSPTQTSLVRGRTPIRNGFRKPCATIRRAFGSELNASGLSGRPWPVAGSTRRRAPSSDVGSPAVRRSWLRSAPPSAVGGVSDRAGAAGWVAARVERAPVLAPVGEVEAGAVAAADVERAVVAEREAADGVARILLAPVLDQHLLGAGHRVAGGLQPREPSGDDAAVGRGAGRCRARVREDAWRAPARRDPADRRVVRVEDVDVRRRREARIEREPEQAAVPEVVHVRAQVGEHASGSGR